MSNIIVDNFYDHKIYNIMIPIDNISFAQKLEIVYYELKKFHIDTGQYTKEHIADELPYDPSFYLNDHNIFSFPIAELHDILSNIKTLLVNACNDNNLDIESQKYYIHGWMNYFPTKMHQSREYEELFWHDHGTKKNEFHGYYSVKAEPSITHYRSNKEKLDRENKNGRLILAKTGLEHAVGKWNFDTPRITIAYNIMPLQHVLYSRETGDNTPFIPLV